MVWRIDEQAMILREIVPQNFARSASQRVIWDPYK